MVFSVRAAFEKQRERRTQLSLQYADLNKSAGERTMAPTAAEADDVTIGDTPEAKHFTRQLSKLYPYQMELLIKSSFNDSIVFLPTGAGKTVIAAAQAARHIALYPDRMVLFVVNTVQLVKQQADVLKRYLGERASIAAVSGGLKQYETLDKFMSNGFNGADQVRAVVIVHDKLLQWCRDCASFFKNYVSLVIFDEVHHATAGPYKSILDSIFATCPRNPALLNTTRDAVRLRAQLDQMAPPTEGDDDARDAYAELLLRPLRQIKLPLIMGLTASPTINFKNGDKELEKLLAATRCRLITPQEQVRNLSKHAHVPTMVSLTYQPRKEEVILRQALMQSIVHLFKRIREIAGDLVKRFYLDKAPIVGKTFTLKCNEMYSYFMTEEFKMKLARLIMEQSTKGGFLSGLVQQAASTLPASQHMRHYAGEAGRIAQSLSEAGQLLEVLSESLILLDEKSMTHCFMKIFQAYDDARLEQLVSMGENDVNGILNVIVLPLVIALFDIMAIYTEKQYIPDFASCAVGVEQQQQKISANMNENEEEHGGYNPSDEANLLLTSEESTEELLKKAQNSTRVDVLIQTLRELQNLFTDSTTHWYGKNFRAIIFATTKENVAFIDARLRSSGLASHDKENRDPSKFIKPKIVIGQSRSSEGYGMTRDAQKQTLNSFREGKTCNLLIATSVAEEGLDIAECSVVIRYDVCSTLRGFLQSRGRARQGESFFITLTNAQYAHNRLNFIVDAIEMQHHTVMQRLARQSADIEKSVRRGEELDQEEADMLPWQTFPESVLSWLETRYKVMLQSVQVANGSNQSGEFTIVAWFPPVGGAGPPFCKRIMAIAEGSREKMRFACMVEFCKKAHEEGYLDELLQSEREQRERESAALAAAGSSSGALTLTGGGRGGGESEAVRRAKAEEFQARSFVLRPIFLLGKGKAPIVAQASTMNGRGMIDLLPGVTAITEYAPQDWSQASMRPDELLRKHLCRSKQPPFRCFIANDGVQLRLETRLNAQERLNRHCPRYVWPPTDDEVEREKVLSTLQLPSDLQREPDSDLLGFSSKVKKEYYSLHSENSMITEVAVMLKAEYECLRLNKMLPDEYEKQVLEEKMETVDDSGGNSLYNRKVILIRSTGNSALEQACLVALRFLGTTLYGPCLYNDVLSVVSRPPR